MTRLIGLLAILLTLAGAAVPAAAADRAIFNAIGYSPDARYFAFEEYGVQDGSGLPFSNIYVVDLTNDSFVKGSPFDVIAPDDTEPPVATIRAKALEAAAPTLKHLDITSAAEIWVMLGDGVGKDDGKTLSWSTPNCCQPGSTEDKVFKLNLTTFAMPTTDECDSLVARAPLGFALSLTDDTGATSEVHRDKTLPKSRGCTDDYRLYAVVAPFDSKGSQVAIISSYPFGFEGDDRRFLVVPLGDVY